MTFRSGHVYVLKVCNGYSEKTVQAQARFVFVIVFVTVFVIGFDAMFVRVYAIGMDALEST